MKSARLLSLMLGLFVLAGCGAGDITETERDRADDDSRATLSRATSAEDTGLEANDDGPASARFQLGTHYERLSPTQPTSSSAERVEVAEVFTYGCPHCYEFESYIAPWARSQSSAISFVRIPATWNDLVRLHARAFYTADALGKLDEMHEAFFAEIHERGNRLDTRDAVAAFFGRFGVAPAVFAETFDSYDVHTRVQRAEDLARRYQIRGVPAIVVNGKYTSNATLAGGYPQLIELIDELAASERSTD